MRQLSDILVVFRRINKNLRKQRRRSRSRWPKPPTRRGRMPNGNQPDGQRSGRPHQHSRAQLHSQRTRGPRARTATREGGARANARRAGLPSSRTHDQHTPSTGHSRHHGSRASRERGGPLRSGSEHLRRRHRRTHGSIYAGGATHENGTTNRQRGQCRQGSSNSSRAGTGAGETDNREDG